MKTIRNLTWFVAGAVAAAAAAYIVVEMQNEDGEWNDAWDVSQKPTNHLLDDSSDSSSEDSEQAAII